ncbi:MAG: hypothetical protein R6X35_05655 [Candidatus Krumholzibacteriia bacterium]
MAMLAAVLIVACAAGCSDTRAPEPDLEARLSLSVQEFDNINPLSFVFVFDPTVSISRLGPVDSLLVRWEMGGEPGWDIDFVPMRKWVDFRGFPLPSGEWTARIEVRDRYGNSSIAWKTLRLPSEVPVPPDLVTGDLLITMDPSPYADRDTVAVGSEFYVILPARYWGERMLVDCGITCSIDGEVVGSRTLPISGPFQDYGNVGYAGRYTVSAPGVHEISVDMRVLGGHGDNDLGNNRKSRSVVFVESGN